jgi:hypothetical protein
MVQRSPLNEVCMSVTSGKHFMVYKNYSTKAYELKHTKYKKNLIFI